MALKRLLGNKEAFIFYKKYSLMNIATITIVFSHKKQLLQHTLYNKVQFNWIYNVCMYVFGTVCHFKSLQSKLTCTTTPWFANRKSETRYLINEIVLAEEPDLTQWQTLQSL
jgi:uncharacterized protein YhhL (DUF1145 family)